MSNPRGLLFATRNPGKLRELRQLLSDLPFNLVELSSFPSVTDIAETGKTFIENACLKAIGYSSQSGLLTLADDSGLEVDALAGAPGVLSARYGGHGVSYADRTARLLGELSDVPEGLRTARFISVVAIADERGEIIKIARGSCEGRLTTSPRGSGGFGYDPIFVPDGFESTFGELPASIKNHISHRARALLQAREFLHSLTAESTAG